MSAGKNRNLHPETQRIRKPCSAPAYGFFLRLMAILCKVSRLIISIAAGRHSAHIGQIQIPCIDQGAAIRLFFFLRGGNLPRQLAHCTFTAQMAEYLQCRNAGFKFPVGAKRSGILLHIGGDQLIGFVNYGRGIYGLQKFLIERIPPQNQGFYCICFLFIALYMMPCRITLHPALFICVPVFPGFTSGQWLWYLMM